MKLSNIYTWNKHDHEDEKYKETYDWEDQRNVESRILASFKDQCDCGQNGNDHENNWDYLKEILKIEIKLFIRKLSDDSKNACSK
jgi:hypothetical protein